MAETRQLHIIVPSEAYDLLKRIALEDRRGLSDVTREALENYLKSRGYDVSMTVERGGDREAARS